MSHQTEDDAIRPCPCADPWNCTETVPGYRCRKGEGFTTTAGTCDRTMASGAMLSPPDDLASLRAQVQALQQEREELTERVDVLREMKTGYCERADGVASRLRELVDKWYREARNIEEHGNNWARATALTSCADDVRAVISVAADATK